MALSRKCSKYFISSATIVNTNPSQHTHKTSNFKMSNLDDRFLLMQALIETNIDNILNIFREIFFSIHDKLIEILEHMFHHNIISSPDNDFEYDGISEITKSTSKTKPSKSDPSSFWNPTQMIKVAHFHQLISKPWHVVTSENLDSVAEYNISKITQSTSKTNLSPKHHKFETWHILSR